MLDSSISNLSNIAARNDFANSKTDSTKSNNLKSSNDSSSKNISSTSESSKTSSISDNAEGVTTDKVLSDGEAPKLDYKTVTSIKSYGVPITAENLKAIATLMKNIPAKALIADLVGLMISKKIPTENADIIEKYLNGKLNFSSLFANLSKETLDELRKSWNSGKLIEKLEQLVKQGKDSSTIAEKKELSEDVVDNLRLQELLSNKTDDNNGNMYFQWPIFWNNQDLPDCLEGEAFFPDKNNPKEGFSLRILVTPPNLGKTEISLTTKEKDLFVHFGVDIKVMDSFRSIFNNLRQSILASGDYKSVHFSVGKIRNLNNFFSTKSENYSNYSPTTNSSIDFKA